MEALRQGYWAGNIRELEHVIERAVILSNGSELNVLSSDLRPNAGWAPRAAPASDQFRHAERDVILRVLKETRGVVGGPDGAAAKLGLKRTTLQSKMRKLGIHRPTF